MIFENQYGICEIIIVDSKAVCVNMSGGPDSAFLLWAVSKAVTSEDIIVKVVTYPHHMVLDNVNNIVEKMRELFPNINYRISHTHNDGSIPISEFLNSIPKGTTQVFNGFQCNPPKDDLIAAGIYDSREVYKDRDRVAFPDSYKGQYWPMRFTSKQWLGQAIIDYDLQWLHQLTSTCDEPVPERPCKKCYGCLERKIFMGSYDWGIQE